MPELPDLQAFSRNLSKRLKGKKVLRVTAAAARSKTPEKEFKKNIEGQHLQDIYREGKQLYFRFGNGTVLGLHLMLHGALEIFEQKNQNRHTVFELAFDDGSGLALTDWQRAATAFLNPEAPAAPDALSRAVNKKFLERELNRKGIVKNILLDQKIIRGIGNAYADEILWKAGISPFSIANKIPAQKVGELAKAIRSVLQSAEKQILKTHPDIISGEVRDFLNIHHPKKTQSPGGAAILTKTNAGRKTYYTEEQRLYR